MSAVLKLVEAQHFNEQLDLSSGSGSSAVHSLQSAFQYTSPWQPALARYIIERFSKPAATVLDPMCSTGVVGVESVLSGRSFVGCDRDRSVVRLARARLFPADLAEVALRLQFVNLKKPVDLRSYREPFPLFFEVDTFRELMNLKMALRGAGDPAAEFVMFIVASILHGHTAGHLSSYTSPSAALSSSAQLALNRKRGEIPSYRAVGARVLKKAALLLRDGLPSVLQDRRVQREVHCSEPYSLEAVQTGSIDLALIAPEQPGFITHGLRSWLRTWWLGVDVPEELPVFSGAEQWQERLSEILTELARVVNHRGRVVIRLGRGRIGAKSIDYGEQAEVVVTQCLSKFWRAEGSIAECYMESSSSTKHRVDRNHENFGQLLVLRRL